jgi:two-component system, chemotaxis family, chemotaxis protein CheY
VVVTDLFMPGLDGIETIQMLRDEFPGARIIAISGGASSGEMGPLKDARMLGADVALPKPFAMAALGRAVRALVERGAAAGEESFDPDV